MDVHTRVLPALAKPFRKRDVGKCGGLNRYDPHRLMCLNAWPVGSDTIRRCGLVGGSVSLWRQSFKTSILAPWKQYSISSLQMKI